MPNLKHQLAAVCLHAYALHLVQKAEEAERRATQTRSVAALLAAYASKIGGVLVPGKPEPTPEPEG